MRDRSDASPAGAIFSPAPISAAPGLISPSPWWLPERPYLPLRPLLTVFRLTLLPRQHSCSGGWYGGSRAGDESGSAPAIPSTSEQPTSVPSLSGDESDPASIITTASFHSGSVSPPIRDQFGSAFYADEESKLFFSEYEYEADTAEDSELSLSDQESEADANSEADNEAETSFSSSYPDNSHSDPSQPLPQLVVSGADLRIRLRRAIEVYVPSWKRTIRFCGEVLAALAGELVMSTPGLQAPPPELPENFTQTSSAPPRPASPFSHAHPRLCHYLPRKGRATWSI